MQYVQLPLPNFDTVEDNSASLVVMLTYSAHTKLRDIVAALFAGEIEILREMGRCNETQCPESWYLEQRQICMTIKKLVNQLDDLNDAMGASFHAE